MTYADKLAQDRMIKEAIEKTARDETVSILADIRSQRTLWMAIWANNRAFGHAQKNTQKFLGAFVEIADWLEETSQKNDAEYALDKLRQQAEKISGMEIGYLYEQEMIEARKRNEARGVFFDPVSEEEIT
jgi:hypothetical protein